MKTILKGEMTPLKLLIMLSASTVALLGLIGIYVAIVAADSMPSLEQLENPRQKLATRVLSADGELLDHFFDERRVPLTYKDIPPAFINALVSTEDRKFWDHWGVHVGRVVNAFVKNIFAGHAKEGGSTITMQLARNLYFTQEGTLARKIRESLTAVQIEKTYTKEEILTIYANTVGFGRGAYGLQVASKVYFDKTPRELTPAQCAFLVGLLKKPEYYNRKENYDAALARRNLVLKLMYDEDKLTGMEYDNALNEPFEFATRDTKPYGAGASGSIAPHFVEAIRQELSKDDRLSEYDLYRDGLVITTTLDSRIQRHLNTALEEHMPEVQQLVDQSFSWARNKDLLDKLIAKAIRNKAEYRAASEDRKQSVAARLRWNQAFIDSIKNAATTVQVGVVIIDPASGAVLAMAGASPKFMKENPDAKYSLNHAMQIKRQPGSSFKPFVYASALMKGMTPSSQIACGPYSYTLPSGEVWSPSGSSGPDGQSSISLTGALTASINSVSARLITQTTSPGEVVSLAQKMGVKSQLRAVPALALGAGGEVDPMEMTSAYGTFAFKGVHTDPYLYTSIESKNGDMISERRANKNITDALPKEIAQQMTYMMESVVNYGTATRVKQYLQGVSAAGKTGTTNDAADAWFVGYTPQLVCGIWMGFDELKVTFDCLGAVGYGGRTAAPLWGRIMGKIYSDPTLPYKQRKFVFNAVDSTNKSPYNYTDAQKSTGNTEPVDLNEENPAPQPEPEAPVSKPKKEATPLPPLPKPKKPNVYFI